MSSMIRLSIPVCVSCTPSGFDKDHRENVYHLLMAETPPHEEEPVQGRHSSRNTQPGNRQRSDMEGPKLARAEPMHVSILNDAPSEHSPDGLGNNGGGGSGGITLKSPRRHVAKAPYGEDIVCESRAMKRFVRDFATRKGKGRK